MKQILPVLAVLFLLSACSDKKEDQAAHDAKVAQQAREELLAQLKAQEEAKRKVAEEKTRQNSLLSQAGITKTPDGKIIIDTNRTKSYFQQLAQKMKTKADKLAKEMQQGIIEEKEAGIEVNQEKIVVDLNKTKGFLEGWAKKMETFVKEMDEVARSVNSEMNESK